MNDTASALEPKNQEGRLATRPPLPPFTRETATLKIRMAEDGCNSRDPSSFLVSSSV
jgi:Protein of unknown function (DUF1348)